MKDDNDIVLSVRNVLKCFEMYEKPVHRLFQTFCVGKRKFFKDFRCRCEGNPHVDLV